MDKSNHLINEVYTSIKGNMIIGLTKKKLLLNKIMFLASTLVRCDIEIKRPHTFQLKLLMQHRILILQLFIDKYSIFIVYQLNSCFC
jgi:hypothetical protein